MIFNILASVFSLTVFAGFAVVLGAFGSYEVDSVGFNTIIMMCGIGFSLIFSGIGGLKVITQAYFKE